MAVALTGEQAALAAAIHDWAAAHDPVAAVRAAEGAGAGVPDGFAKLGLLGIALPPSAGGAGGSVADLATGLAAAAEALVPGPLLGTAVAGLALGRLGERFADGMAHAAVLLEAPYENGVLHGGTGPVPGADAAAWLLVPVPGGHVLLPPGTAGVEPLAPFDFSRPLARVHFDHVPVTGVLELPDVRDLAATLAVAEAAGVARWCLTTAVEYAKVREQFGQVIGAFQAVKHLCAEMLCRAEAAEALAWDAASAAGGPQHAAAVASAAAVALDAAVANAKDCVQVLGGIGFTWEHPAHLYLRRALALRHWLGGSSAWRRRAAELALAGERRTLDVDLGTSPEITALAREIARLPEDRRRGALAEQRLLAPHWPKPYGRDAGPAEQLRIDAALADAGVRRPDLVIGAWAVPTILAHGTPSQCERFVGPTLRGELVWCQLFSEPGAGSDLAALRTAARRVDGGWRLTGQKVWTSLAHEADRAICLARTDPGAPKHKGITYFLVDMHSPGITTRPLREITGASVFNEVFLDDVFVPDADVVGDPGAGWRLARTTLAGERVALGKGSAAGEGVEALLAGAGPDLDRDRLGALIGAGTACSVLDLRATLRRLDGQGPGAESSVAKLLGVRHRQDVAEFALDHHPTLLPGDAPSHEFLLSRCLSIAGGTTQILLSAVAERVLGLPR
ncbi:MAG TPA: acyl-CoA dehydrogenase family protein [Amycolatopsis sp.]|nr:acyl-CoA dehydrogenase family protein [Amycolatopsis sp.]